MSVSVSERRVKYVILTFKESIDKFMVGSNNEAPILLLGAREFDEIGPRHTELWRNSDRETGDGRENVAYRSAMNERRNTSKAACLTHLAQRRNDLCAMGT